MKTATDKFKAAIHKRNRAFKFKLDFGDFIISSLDSFKTESISCGSAGLTFGTVAIGNGTLKGRKLGHTVNGKSFSAYIGLDIDGVTEYVKIGKYTVYNEEVKGIETTAEFQDDIAKLDVDFAATLTYPAAATAILSYIETTCGIVFDKSNIPSTLKVNKDLTGYSCRDVVGFVAQLIGCFACIDNSTDKIAFKWYTDTGYTIDSDNYLYMIKEPVKGDTFELSLISCDADGEALSQGTGTGVVHIVNPIMTDSILQTVYTARAGFSYNEGNIQFVLGNPLLDIWDIVTATYNGVTTKIPCMNIKTTFNGGFQSDISAYIRNKNSAFEGKMTKELGKLKTEITVIEGSVSSKVSKGEVISEINQSPEAVTIKASKINLKGAVTADAIAAGAVTTDKIKSGAVTAEKIDVEDLFAKNLTMKGTFTAKGSAYINPGKEELDYIKQVLFGVITPTAEEIALYDFSGDGKITITDFTQCQSMVAGMMNMADITTGFAKKLSPVTVTITPNDVYKTIRIQATNMWGRTIDKYIGANSPFLGDDNQGVFEVFVNGSETIADILSRVKSLEEYTGGQVANSVANALTVKANDTTLYTFNGSEAKTINIKAGANVTLSTDSAGNITIAAVSPTADVGEVVYEATSGGLYCDGKTTKSDKNSFEIPDPNPNGYYKRFRFYCQGYYGLVCVDMPLDREHPSYTTSDGTRYGGVIFPTAENSNINSSGIGSSNHMYYELKWKVVRDLPYWRVQIVDSGWLGLNAGKTSDANYTENASTADAGTGYVSWNQRHNNQYCIYKIVGYKI